MIVYRLCLQAGNIIIFTTSPNVVPVGIKALKFRNNVKLLPLYDTLCLHYIMQDCARDFDNAHPYAVFITFVVGCLSIQDISINGKYSVLIMCRYIHALYVRTCVCLLCVLIAYGLNVFRYSFRLIFI